MADPFCTKEAFGRTIFHESKHFMVLYDIKPVVRGHILFVPKRHVLDILEFSSDEARELHDLFHSVIPRILSIYKATENSYDITSQVGPYSGRSVAHLHMHMIPRRKEDEYQGSDSIIYEDIKLNRTHFTEKEVETEVARLRKEFGFKQAQK